MFTSFDENVFRKAIAEKDFLRLKINTVSAMSYDPTFEKGEANAVLEILKKEVPEIFEEYDEKDYEERLEPEKWDERYFSKLLYWFQKNFAEERIPLIKKVGKKVNASTPKAPAERTGTQLNSGSASPKTNVKGNANFTQAPEKKNAMTGMFIVAGVVVLVLTVLVKLLSK